MNSFENLDNNNKYVSYLYRIDKVKLGFLQKMKLVFP